VRDDRGDPIPNVHVFNQDKPAEYTFSDINGNYSIEISANRDIVLVFRWVAGSEEQKKVNVQPDETYPLTVFIRNVESLSSATVSGSSDRGKPMQTLDPQLVKSLPTPGGGIEGVLRSAPVNFTSELSSSYSVRGGSFDENLVYVNDIQVYRPFLVRAGQQEGLSFPNPDMVESIEFSAGGFESKYGDKMSSVLDLKYRRPSEFSGSISGSLLGGSVQLEGISENRKFSHNSGIRYRNNSYVLGSLDTQGDYNPRYTDFQTFLTFTPKEYGNLEFNFLGNYSRNLYNFIPQTRQTDVGNINEALRLTVYFDGQERSQFETFFGAFATHYNPSEKSRLSLITSAFRTFEREYFDILGQYFLDELERDLGSDSFGEVLRNRGVGSFLEHARNDLDATVVNVTHKGFSDLDASGHFLEWGARWQQETINDRLSEWTLIDSAGYASPRPPDNIGYTDPSDRPFQEIYLHDVIKINNQISSNRVTGYFQDTYSWEAADSSKVNLNLGVRGHFWDFNDQFVWGPRGHLSYQPNWKKRKVDPVTGQDTTIHRNLVLSLAGGVYWQPAFYREMRGLTGEINSDIQAQRAIHAVAGADYIFFGWGRPFKLVTEVYYKDLSSLIPYEVENVRLRYYATNNSKGYSTGIDVMLNGEFIDGIQSWLRMSVLKTEEDILDDFYYEYVNSDGDIIIPGFTLNDDAVDSTLQTPGFIPRATDQRFTFSLLFQDEMPKWPEYKV
ncbi:MAG: TonB-dependent receptor, partial [Flavobacteriales bacterium]|nr:TonB-dependent receptor [Flavobacteriales bacterium]